jgi:hypothetical protein
LRACSFNTTSFFERLLRFQKESALLKAATPSQQAASFQIQREIGARVRRALLDAAVEKLDEFWTRS